MSPNNVTKNAQYQYYLQTLPSNTYLNLFQKYTLEELTSMSVNGLKATGYDIFQTIDPQYAKDDLQSIFETLLNPIQSTVASVKTNPIAVTNSPSTIQILIQPPQIIYVGDQFDINIATVIDNGAPTAKTFVQAAIFPDNGPSVDTSNSANLQDLFNQLSSGATGANQLTLMGASKNLVLDSTTTSDKANKNGICVFTLRILASIPGNFAAQFQTPTAQSPKTNTFTVLNRITAVYYINDISAEVAVDVTKKQYAILPIQPNILINYTDYQTTNQKYIQIKVYHALGSVQPNNSLSAASVNQQPNTTCSNVTIGTGINATNTTVCTTTVPSNTFPNQSLGAEYNSAQSSPSAQTSTGTGTFQTTLSIISSAGRLVKSIQSQDVNAPYGFTYPLEDENGILYFQDVSIMFPDYGLYRVVFIIDGIETPATNIITVGPPGLTIVQKVLNSFGTIAIILVVLFVMIANSAYHNVLWIISGFSSVAVAYVLIVTGPGEIGLQSGLLFGVFAVIILALIEVTYQLYMRSKKRTGWLPYVAREEMFREYTYQMLFAHPSGRWKKICGYHTGQQHLDNEIDQSYYEPKLPDSDHLHEISEKLIQESQNPKNEDMLRGEQEEQKDEAETLLLRDDVASPTRSKKIYYPEGVRVIDRPSRRRPPQKFFQQVKELFIPFYYSYKHLEIGEVFFYPQKIFAGMLLGTVSAMYFAYKTFVLIAAFADSIYGVHVTVGDQFGQFVATATQTMQSNTKGTTFNENTFSSLGGIVAFVESQVYSLSKALIIGFNISSALSCIIFVGALFALLDDFKSRVLKHRRGERTFDHQKNPIPTSTNYIGLQIANSAVSWALVAIIIGFVLTPLFYPLFWLVIYENLNAILLIIIMPIVKAISGYIVTKFAINPETGIIRRRLWSIWELYMFFISILAGVAAAISRFLVLIVVSVFALARLDQSLIADWILQFVNLDGTNVAYLATVHIYHLHNHPIFITFAHILLRSLDREVDDNEHVEVVERRIRVANRLRLWLFMYRNRHLKLPQYRKHNLKLPAEALQKKADTKQASPKRKPINVELPPKEEPASAFNFSHDRSPSPFMGKNIDLENVNVEVDDSRGPQN
jgi:hypothetical protein